MAAELLTTSTTLAAPPVAMITRWLNDALRTVSGEPNPASELCGESAEFMGMLDGEED